MASHYDAKSSCRVGTMDEAQFYAESEPGNGAYFRGLIAQWLKAKGTLKWGAGGVSLRGLVAGKSISICFLAPQFAGKKDRIELACATLTKQIGQAQSDALTHTLRAAAGDQVLGKTMISVVQPGALASAKQTALTQAFLNLL